MVSRVGGLGRFGLPDDAQERFQASLEQLLGSNGVRPAAIRKAGLRESKCRCGHPRPCRPADLLGAGIGRGADELLELGEQRLVGKARPDGLGDAKINYFRRGHPIHFGHQNVRRLDVAVNDAFVMRVLDGVADLNEEPQPLGGGKLVLVAVVGDPMPRTSSMTK